MIEFILGSFLYAKFKKGYKLKYIFKYPYIFTIIPPLLCALLYIFIEICVWNQWHWFLPYQHIIKTITLLSYIPLLYTYKLFKNDNPKYINNEAMQVLTSPMFKAGFCLWLGSTLNKIVINANNGMPVFPSNTYWTGYAKPEFVQDGIHILGNAYTKLIPLSDWIDIFYSVLSPGDILIRMFIFLILYYAIEKSNKILTK